MSSAPKTIWTPSNVITIVRILLVPIFVAALLTPWPEWFGAAASFSNDWKSIVAAAIFVIISCTDWLDGYLARSRNEVTDFGKFMDPLADKILVAAALIALVELGSLPTWVVLIILAREFIVSGVRMMAASEGVVIAASMLGKFKTVFQMIAIVLFTIKESHMIGSFGDAISDALWVVSWLVMLVALGLTIASMVDYLVKARELIGLAPSAKGASQDFDSVADRPLDAELIQGRAQDVIDAARAGSVTLSTAESLTGGMIGSALTGIAGSSDVFLGGIVSYASEVKHDVLGVSLDVLRSEGAVCEQVAREMAEGARRVTGADIGVSVTGIAGPGGGEPGKPVGTVWIGSSSSCGASAHDHLFEGDRESVRMQTVYAALGAFEEELEKAKRIPVE